MIKYLNVLGRHTSQLAMENHLATKRILKRFTVQRHNLNTIIHAKLLNLHINTRCTIFGSHMKHICVQWRIIPTAAMKSLEIALNLSAMGVAELANTVAARRKVTQQSVVGFVTARGGEEAFCGLDKKDTHGMEVWLCVELSE
jgi:hypothetical protein